MNSPLKKTQPQNVTSDIARCLVAFANLDAHVFLESTNSIFYQFISQYWNLALFPKLWENVISHRFCIHYNYLHYLFEWDEYSRKHEIDKAEKKWNTWKMDLHVWSLKKYIVTCTQIPIL